MKCCRCHLHCRRRRPARGSNPGEDNGVVFVVIVVAVGGGVGGGVAAAAAARARVRGSSALDRTQ